MNTALLATAQQHSYDFAIVQYYRVTLDESGIDTLITESFSGDTTVIEAYRLRMHRMFQAILVDPQALSTVLEYRVLSVHDLSHQTNERFLKDRYGGEAPTFAHIITRIASCFSTEDQAWWQEITKEYAEAEARYQAGTADKDGGEGLPLRDCDLPIEVEPLEQCFKVEHDGWHMSEVKCMCIEGTAQVV